MQYTFKATIYKTGINWCVDVPPDITDQLMPEKGYIHIKGEINGYVFSKTLVPVKNGPYRLFVNHLMMKGGHTALGQEANFLIEQVPREIVPVPDAHPELTAALQEEGLEPAFDALTAARKRDVIKYLYQVKTAETRIRNIATLIAQLKNGETNVRIPMATYPVPADQPIRSS